MVLRFIKWMIPDTLREGLLYALSACTIAYLVHAIYIDTRVWHTIDSQVLTPVVTAGENFQIRYQVEWSSSCEVRGFRFIVDGNGYQHERTMDIRNVDAGFDDFTLSIPVPLSAASGQAYYTGVVQYVCNPIQRWLSPMEVELMARPFTIVKSSHGVSRTAGAFNVIQLSEW